MAYHNERNGWVDNGKKLNNEPCPNCGSKNFAETVSREYCPDCKMECDYWGDGSNEVYDAYCERKWSEDERRREEDFRRQMREEWGDHNG